MEIHAAEHVDAQALGCPHTPDALHHWILRNTGVEIVRDPILGASSAPFDYLLHTFFEGAAIGPGGDPPASRPPRSSPDCIVWANRGGGKTFLGALATLLDMVFKPGIEVRVLGGSLEQSQRMHEHLRRFFDRPTLAFLLKWMTERAIVLKNGSRAQVLAQSQASVRGTRVQKIRCDEVELFDREIWEAAQLTTRSMPLPGPWGAAVRGSVEALSTMHEPYGLMWEIVGSAERAPSASSGMGAQRPSASPHPHASESVRQHHPSRRLFRWGIVDTLGACGPEHACGSCAMFTECAGRAKKRPIGSAVGHVSIDDALKMKSRVGAAAWEAEMLCLRPRRDSSVLPEFDPAIHIGDWETPRQPPAPFYDPLRTEPIGRSPAIAVPAGPHGHALWIAGMDFGYRAPTVVLLAWLDSEGVLRIESERVQSEQTLGTHIAAIAAGLPAGGASCPRPSWIGIDPAGNQREIQSGISAATALKQAGLVVRSRWSEIPEGLALIRSRLRPALGGPRLFIHRRCQTLIECMQRYHYDPGEPESMVPVKDGFDHAIDALRYMVVNLDRPAKVRVRRYW